VRVVRRKLFVFVPATALENPREALFDSHPYKQPAFDIYALPEPEL
jgi:hypothetical protein